MNNYNIELFKAYKTIRPICHNGIEKNIDLKFSNGFQEKNLHAIIILKTDQWFYYVPLVSYKNDYLEMYEKNSWNNVIINNAISRKNDSNSFSVALVVSINKSINFEISNYNQIISQKDQQKILNQIRLNLLEYLPKMVINEVKINHFNKVEGQLIYGNKDELFQNINFQKKSTD